MLDAACREQSREQIADHAPLTSMSFPSVAPRPGRGVDVRRLQDPERLLEAFGDEQVRGYMAHARHEASVARQVVDFGAATDQFPGRCRGRRCPSRRRRVRQYSGFLPCRRSTVATRAPEASVSFSSIKIPRQAQRRAILTITFIALPSDRAASGTRVDDRLRFDPSGADLLDGKLAARNHPDHARPHCDPGTAIARAASTLIFKPAAIPGHSITESTPTRPPCWRGYCR
jgi:hypothetical protein